MREGHDKGTGLRQLTTEEGRHRLHRTALLDCLVTRSSTREFSVPPAGVLACLLALPLFSALAKLSHTSSSNQSPPALGGLTSFDKPYTLLADDRRPSRRYHLRVICLLHRSVLPIAANRGRRNLQHHNKLADVPARCGGSSIPYHLQLSAAFSLDWTPAQ